jgi:hypothetical protein
LPDLYIPRGYISTREAFVRLFEARHPDIVSSAPEREAEQRRLYGLKTMSKPPPMTTLGHGGPERTEHQLAEFTSTHEQRLRELGAIEREANSLLATATNDVRTALAEGDLSAVLQLDSGEQKPIRQARWRAKDGLSVVHTARDKMARFYDVGTVAGTVLIKEADFTVWISTIGAPKKFSQVHVSVIAQVHPLPAPIAGPTVSPPAREDYTETLPLWLTPMEAVAWIVARHSLIVGYSSPERNAVRTFVIDHVLPNGKRVSGEVEAPAGMSLLWLDLFAACDTSEALSTDKALTELHAALRLGRVTARAIWVATGDRRDMCADEWHGLVLDTPPRNERGLLPYRINAGTLAKQLDSRWRDVLLPRARLLVIWPEVPAMPPTETTLSTTGEPAVVAGGDRHDNAPNPAASLHGEQCAPKNRGGRPLEWDWDAFNRELLRLANTPDGLPDRAKLQRYMLGWCEQTWGRSPADSTVRDRIARLYPG